MTGPREIEPAEPRATLRHCGALRIVLEPIVFIGWARGSAAVITIAIGTLLPLRILAAGFEATFTRHVSEQRVDPLRFTDVTEGRRRPVAAIQNPTAWCPTFKRDGIPPWRTR